MGLYSAILYLLSGKEPLLYQKQILQHLERGEIQSVGNCFLPAGIMFGWKGYSTVI